MRMITRRDMIKTIGLAAGAFTMSELGGMAFAAGKANLQATGEYTLPELPYDYNALEPHLTEQLLRLHHDKHHAGYVSGLNAVLKKIAGATELDQGTVKTLAFHGSGHALHTLYWGNMSKQGGGEPNGITADMINRDFGSYEKFKTLFISTGKGIQGNGWVVFAFEPMGKRFVLLGVQRHEDSFFVNTTPVLVMDMWEHAYYLQYQNDKAKYIDAFINNLVNWSAVEERLRAIV